MSVSKATKQRRSVFYGWYIVGASVAINFYLSLAFFLGFQVFFLPILREFGWSRALTSGAFSLRQLEFGLLSPAIGFMVDRWGPRTIILLGVVLGGAGMVLISTISSVWTFYLAFLVASMGMSGASHGVSWSVAVAKWFRRLRGRALGIAMLGPVVAGPFVVVVGLLEETVGWRTAIMVLGIGVWIVGIPLSLVARSDPASYGDFPDGDVPDDAEADTGTNANNALGGGATGLTVRQALATRDFWVFTLLFAAQFIGISGLMVHLIPLLEDAKYTTSQAAGFLGLVFLFSGIGRVGAGFLVDMVDRRLVLFGLILSQIVALMVLTRIGPLAYFQVGGFALLLGIGFGGMIPLRPFLLMQAFGPRAFGAIQGLVQGAAIAAGVVGPIGYGYIFDVVGSYNVAIFATVAVMVAAMPLVFLFSPTRT